MFMRCNAISFYVKTIIIYCNWEQSYYFESLFIFIGPFLILFGILAKNRPDEIPKNKVRLYINNRHKFTSSMN